MSNFDDLYPGKHNFCRVFELPVHYPEGFCFDGGKPVAMNMVDWFNPWPESIMFPKDKIPKNWQECSELLQGFLKDKRYVKTGRQYLLITEFGESMLFKGKTND